MARFTIVLTVLVFISACNGSVQEVEKTDNIKESMNDSKPSAPAEEIVDIPSEKEIDNSGSEEKPESTVKTEVSPKLKDEAQELLNKLGEEYIAGIEGPFIVIGNIPEYNFKRFMRYTIRACSQCMYKQYFEKKPDYTIKIYLFGDEASYRSMAKKLWNDTDVSHFGYYKPSQRTMVASLIS